MRCVIVYSDQLLGARHTLIYLITIEEQRVDASMKYLRSWWHLMNNFILLFGQGLCRTFFTASQINLNYVLIFGAKSSKLQIWLETNMECWMLKSSHQCLFEGIVLSWCTRLYSTIRQNWTISWTKVRYRGNSVPMIWQTKGIRQTGLI